MVTRTVFQSSISLSHFDMANGKKKGNGGGVNGDTPPDGVPRVNLSALFAKGLEERLERAITGIPPEMPIVKRLVEAIGRDVKILIATTPTDLNHAREDLEKTNGDVTTLARKPLTLPGACYATLLHFIVAHTGVDAKSLISTLKEKSATEIPATDLEAMFNAAKTTFDQGLFSRALGTGSLSLEGASEAVRCQVEVLIASWQNYAKNVAISVAG